MPVIRQAFRHHPGGVDHPLPQFRQAKGQAYGRDVAELNASQRRPADKAERQAARSLVAAYHQQELRRLLEEVATALFDSMPARSTSSSLTT